MTTATGPYSPLKIFHHQDRLDVLRRGKQPVPAQVQLILSDLCQQSCFAAGTMVECPEGQRAIETLAVGDTVNTPDGGEHTIERHGSRRVDGLYRITCGSRVIECSSNHPFLTEDGWRPAEAIKVGVRTAMRVRLRGGDDVERAAENVDNLAARSPSAGRSQEASKNNTATEQAAARRGSGAAMRVRVRRKAEVESPLEKMGKVHPWPQQKAGEQVCRQDETASDEGGVPRAASVSVRLREAGDAVPEGGSEILVGLRKGASDEGPGHAYGGVQAAAVRKDEGRQPDVGRKNGRQVTPESRADIGAEQERNAVPPHNIAMAPGRRYPLYGERDVLGEPPQPRLESQGPEKGDRANGGGDFQRGGGGDADAGGLCVAERPALSSVRIPMPGDIPQESPLSDSTGAAENSGGLRLGGVDLEWGVELRQIDKIEQLDGSHVVYNFEVPPVHAYIANGFTVANCHFCAYRWEGYTSNELFKVIEADGTVNNNPNRMIPTDKVREILRDCHDMGVGAIQFTGGGEPTLHPDFGDLIEYTLELGLQFALVTNAVRLRPDWMPSLQQASWVRVSIDAGLPETYAAIRGANPKTFGQVLEKVGWLAEGIREGGRVGVGFVVTKENWHEVQRAAQLAKDAGADNFRISAVFQPDGSEYFADFYEAASAACREAESLACDGFDVFNLFGDRVEDLAQHSPDYHFCGYQNFNTYIGADLNVYRCCGQAYNERGLIGSLKTQGFRELWEGDAKRADFEGFDASGCEVCQFNAKNRTILYALDEAPAHVNFV